MPLCFRVCALAARRVFSRMVGTFEGFGLKTHSMQLQLQFTRYFIIKFCSDNSFWVGNLFSFLRHGYVKIFFRLPWTCLSESFLCHVYPKTVHHLVEQRKILQKLFCLRRGEWVLYSGLFEILVYNVPSKKYLHPPPNSVFERSFNTKTN